MKENLYTTGYGKKKLITEYPLVFEVMSYDDKPLEVTIEDEVEHWGLYLYIPSTGEKAKIANCVTALTIGVILGEFQRKYESVFAHVVHHRQTIPLVPGERGIYHGLPPFRGTPSHRRKKRA